MMEGIGNPVPQGSGLDNDNFDRVLEESEEELAKLARQHHTRSVKDKILELDEVSLRCHEIDNDSTFNKLKFFLRTFTIKADEAIHSGTTHEMVDFPFQVRLHDCLRNMLREVIQTADVERQKLYLTRVYKWFFGKMSSIGAISSQQKQSEDEFMNPDKYAEIERKKQEEVLFKKQRLMDDTYNNEVQKGWFEAGERTIHKDIIPARERIDMYRRKLPKDPNMSTSMLESTSTRPNTKSSTRVRTANTATRADTVYGQTFRPSFNTFFTSGEKVEFDSLLRVESKGSYANYIPADNIVEQKLQKMWKEVKNKEIAEKRVNDELQKNMKEWGDAKARYEEDIQRKTENKWFGSNFGARAFVRRTKTKKIDLLRNHLDDSDGSSMLSDSELEELEKLDTEEAGEGEDNIEEEFKTNTRVERPHVGTNLRNQNDVRIRKSRAKTCVRTKRRPPIPKMVDTSQERGEKLCFANVDPVGAQKLAELNDPKAKPKVPEPPPEEPPRDLGVIRPKTTDAGKRKINMLRRFHGGLINASGNNMEMINNVFTSSGGQEPISLSVYNNSTSYQNGKYTQSATTLPNAKLHPSMRPQSAPFAFADGTRFNQSIRHDKREEIAEIDSLKNRLASDDVPFKVETIRKAFEMPGEREFKIKRYPAEGDYLMKNPFPKKKKKGKKGKKKRKKKG